MFWTYWQSVVTSKRIVKRSCPIASTNHDPNAEPPNTTPPPKSIPRAPDAPGTVLNEASTRRRSGSKKRPGDQPCAVLDHRSRRGHGLVRLLLLLPCEPGIKIQRPGKGPRIMTATLVSGQEEPEKTGRECKMSQFQDRPFHFHCKLGNHGLKAGGASRPCRGWQRPQHENR